MDAVILVKTRKGQDELANRSGAVSQQQRAMLILVDGKTVSSALVSKCAFFSQCSEHLEWLLAHGYVEVSLASDKAAGATLEPASVRGALIAMTHELLGVHASAVVRRLQETPDNPDALKAVLERCHKLIRLSIDEKKAEQFLQQGTALLHLA